MKSLLLISLLIAGGWLTGGELLRNTGFAREETAAVPQNWKLTVNKLRQNAVSPQQPLRQKEGALFLDAGQGGCEVVLHQPYLALPVGKYKLSFKVSGSSLCSYRGVVMYQMTVNGKKAWRHSPADWARAPQKETVREIAFTVPGKAVSAYFFLAVRGSGQARFQNLSLLKMDAETALRKDPPAKFWNFEVLQKVPKYRTVDFEESRVAGMRSIVYDSAPVNGKSGKVFAYLALPEGKAPQGGFPGVVLVHGGTGTAFPQYVRNWTKRGYAVIAMDHYGTRPDVRHPGKTLPLAGGIYRLEEWAFRAVNAIVEAHSILLSQPEINREKTAVIGISWGGVFTSLVSAVDPRFKGAVAVYGCGFWDQGDPQLGFTRYGNRDWDPKHFLHAARVPLYWVDGTNDIHFGVRPLECSINAAPSTVNRTLIKELPHGHQGFLFPAVIRTVDALLRGGTPLPKLGKVQIRNGIASVPVLEPGKGIAYVGLLYTCDGNPAAMKRKWIQVPAQLKQNRVLAKLPAGVTQFALIAADEPPSGAAPATVCSDVIFLN